MQNPAVAVVDDLNRRVDAAGGDEVDLVAVGLLCRDFDGLARFQLVAQADVEDFGAVEIEGLAAFAFAPKKYIPSIC